MKILRVRSDSAVLWQVGLRPLSAWIVKIVLILCISMRISAEENKSTFPEVFNTEAAGQAPPPAEQMLQMIELPTGFNVTLLAAEPDVQQPICMDFDDRGRLWVAENYTYSGGDYETKLRDRVIILEDSDHDGRHDRRTVFWDKGFMLTSLAWGFGGLWILHDGTLSFIPDRDQDDVPDSEPIVMLDGWSKDCGHNFVSGLIWGPDGWLYGRHGIVDTSYPGQPGTPQQDRPAMNCGVWRYHPWTRQVESVCYGTTNPWGLDYDQNGQFFMTNNVQGHLWHVLPGAHFQRMYGQDFNPHFYELMEMTADHYHWDTTRKWYESRDGIANDLGGGHSHVGAVIYQGKNFPASYRGQIFMCNTHGRRLNVNRLQRSGSGFVGTREPDFMLIRNPWFRGVDLKVGPDGTLYVADWSDNGECHDHDGIHRTSGRIYRVAYGQPTKYQPATPLADQSSTELLGLLNSDNAWQSRRALRILQERQQSEWKLSRLQIAKSHQLPLLAAEALGVNEPEDLRRWLLSQDREQVEHAVQLAGLTAQRRQELLPDLKHLAGTKTTDNVLMALISVLRRFEHPQRLELATAILTDSNNSRRIASENNLTLMSWYGIEPVVREVAQVQLVRSVPKLEQFAVRRLAHQTFERPQLSAQVLSWIAQRVEAGQSQSASALLNAFRLGLAGRARVERPANWSELSARLRASDHAELLLQVDQLSLLMGDGAALDELRSLAIDPQRDVPAREQAIAALGQAGDQVFLPSFYNLLADRAVADAAIKALNNFNHPDVAAELISRYSGFRDGNQSLALDTLASRAAFAIPLIEAIQAGGLNAKALTASQVRQLLSLNEPRIKPVLDQHWGIVQETPAAKLAAIERWRQLLTTEMLAQVNMEAGAELFKKNCANCHKLYGEGQSIGPDLTGSNRGNLEYLLGNIIDPSAVVPKQFTASIILLRSGRVLTGVIIGQTEQVLMVQTEKEKLSLDREEVEQVQESHKSLMPDGLLDSLSPEQVRDLVGFIVARQ